MRSQLFGNVLSGYLTIAGLIMLLIAAVMIAARVRLLISGERVEGVVVGHKARFQHHRREQLNHMPIVRFGAGLKSIEFQSRTGGGLSRHPLGSHVRVVYLPSAPNRALILGSIEIWVAPAAIALFGILLLASAFKAAGVVAWP